MTGHVNISGAWKAVDDAQVNIGGIWKPVEAGYVNISGSWKEFYRSPVRSMSLVATVTGLTSITIPATAQSGDLAILFTAAHGTAIPKVWPSTWTEVREDHDIDDSRMVSGYKILAPSDIGATITGINSTRDAIGVMIFRPNVSITSVSVSGINGEGTISDPSAQTILMSGQNNTIIGVSFMSGSSGSVVATYSPNVMTSITMANGSTGVGAIMGHVVYGKGTGSLNVSVDMTDRGDNVMQSWAITVI